MTTLMSTAPLRGLDELDPLEALAIISCQFQTQIFEFRMSRRLWSESGLLQNKLYDLNELIPSSDFHQGTASLLRRRLHSL